MSTESTTSRTAPLQCRGCSGTAGPFTKAGLCEDCADAETALRSALEDGGWLDAKADRLMAAYMAVQLGKAANTLRTIPGNESAARIVDNLAQRYGR